MPRRSGIATPTRRRSRRSGIRSAAWRVDPHTDAAPRRARGPHPLLLLGQGAAAKFAADPAKYLGGDGTGPALAPSRRRPALVYTCPMHPRGAPAGPATARSAAWRWSREVAAGEDGPNPELADMSRRFWVGLALTLPVLVLAMGGHCRPASTRRLSTHLQLGPARSATPVVLWAGWPFFLRGWQSVVNRSLNMFTLIALGIGVACLQRGGHGRPGLFPAAFRGRRRGRRLLRGGGGDHGAGAAGPGAGAAARERTGGAIRALLDLAPKTARRIARRTEEDVPLEQVRPATSCACGPVRRCRSTASCWRAPARGRIDGHRRTGAGGETPGAVVIGGTLNGWAPS